MKTSALIIASLSLLFACGKTEQITDGDMVGQFREAVVVPATASEFSDISNLCQNLQDKNANFQIQQLNTPFNFSTSFTNCDGSSVNSNVSTMLRLSAGVLNYEVLSGTNFLTQVETHSSGVMSSLCQGLAQLTQPLKTGSMAIWYSVISGAGCSTNSNVRCVKMEIGLQQADGRYLVSVIDRFQVDFSAGPLLGMVLRHDRTNTSSCNEGKFTITTSQFTGKN